MFAIKKICIRLLSTDIELENSISSSIRTLILIGNSCVLLAYGNQRNMCHSDQNHSDLVVLCTTRVGYYCIHELLLHDLLRGLRESRSS